MYSFSSRNVVTSQHLSFYQFSHVSHCVLQINLYHLNVRSVSTIRHMPYRLYCFQFPSHFFRVLNIFQHLFSESQNSVIQIYLVRYLRIHCYQFCSHLVYAVGPNYTSSPFLRPGFFSKFFEEHLSSWWCPSLIYRLLYMFKVPSLSRGTVPTMASIPDAAHQPTRNEKDILTTVPISPTPFQGKTKFGAPGRRTGTIITIIGSACANLSDGFQQGLASSTNVIFNHLMGTKVYTSAVQTRMSNSLLVGSVIGILVFGYLADRVSRKGGSQFILFCLKVSYR